jgi:hypothetical protein
MIPYKSPFCEPTFMAGMADAFPHHVKKAPGDYANAPSNGWSLEFPSPMGARPGYVSPFAARYDDDMCLDTTTVLKFK